MRSEQDIPFIRPGPVSSSVFVILDMNSSWIQACIGRIVVVVVNLRVFLPTPAFLSRWQIKKKKNWGQPGGGENKSLSHNNNPLSSITDLAVSQTFMFLQSCAVKCVTSAQLTFVVIGP